MPTTEVIQQPQDEIQVFVDKELALSAYRLEQIKAFYPLDQAGYDYAAGLAKQAKQEKERLDGERTKITKPMREALQAVQDRFMPPIRKYDEMITLLKDRMVKCKGLLQAQHDAAMLAAQAAYQQGNMQQLAQSTQVMAQSNFEAPQGVGTRVTWGFEVTDYNQIPREFWCVNESAIQQAIVASQGQIQIPGVKVVRKEGVVLR